MNKLNLNKNQKILFVVGIATFLILIIGSAYAYFLINNTNSSTESKARGELAEQGNVTLTTNIDKLYLSLNATDMDESNKGLIYYANKDVSGTPIVDDIKLGTGIYTLATVSLDKGSTKYDCTYKYKLTASIDKTISDGSDEDVKVKISGDSITNGSVEYTLKELIDAGSTGIDLTGTFKSITTGENQTITIESTVANTEDLQDDLAGSKYTINIEPYPDNEGFSCKIAVSTPFAEELIASNTLWSSGLEGDGYRYTGTNPSNYICFGTNDKATCTSNPNTYMYRIIGVFPDEQGNQHLKLIKYASLPSTMTWNDDAFSDVDWGNSTLYSALNGSTYLNNTTYIPSGWEDKITNWKWSAVNTLTYEQLTNGIDYYESPPRAIYEHEMHKKIAGVCYNYTPTSSSCTAGEWTTPSGKIGLMYASDYTLSLGDTAKNMTTGTNANRATLKTGWMHISNNADPTGDGYEWTMSRKGKNSSDYIAWFVRSGGHVDGSNVPGTFAARPVFYLTSDTTVKAGSTGTIEDPYIIE